MARRGLLGMLALEAHQGAGQLQSWNVAPSLDLAANSQSMPGSGVAPNWPSQPAPVLQAPAPNVQQHNGFCAGRGGDQFSGYLSAGLEVSYFFWLAKSHSQPRPLLMWLSGGPGCSSSLAMLVENGPCVLEGRNADGSWAAKPNPYSWTDIANVLWVDQPSNVGYSDGPGISTNENDVANHMYQFLQSFFNRFPEFRSAPFYITGESFGGHYIPAIAKKVVQMQSNGGDIRIDGVAIGNGLVAPETQFLSQPQMAYTGGAEAGGSFSGGVIDAQAYQSMLATQATCIAGVEKCRKLKDFETCVPAMMGCMMPNMEPIIASGRNPYDLRKVCPQELQPLCVNITNEINFMNDAKVQDKIGVKPYRTWLPCSMAAGIPFAFDGDELTSYSPDVGFLLDNGVRVLVYYGDTDYMCDWIGGKEWTMKVEWSHKAEWQAAADEEWGFDGKVYGRQRSVADFTYLQIYNSGHLVPSDQPEAALRLMSDFMSDLSQVTSGEAAEQTHQKPLPLAFAAATLAAALSFAAFRARWRRQSTEAEAYLLIH